jgi:hypothetical protein
VTTSPPSVVRICFCQGVGLDVPTGTGCNCRLCDRTVGYCAVVRRDETSSVTTIASGSLGISTGIAAVASGDLGVDERDIGDDTATGQCRYQCGVSAVHLVRGAGTRYPQPRNRVTCPVEGPSELRASFPDRVEAVPAVGCRVRHEVVARRRLVEIGGQCEVGVEVLPHVVEVVPVRDFVGRSRGAVTASVECGTGCGLLSVVL